MKVFEARTVLSAACAAAIAAVAGLSSQAQALTYTWDGDATGNIAPAAGANIAPADGNMSLAGNWDSNVTPGSGDIANFAATNAFAGFAPIVKGTDVSAEGGVGLSVLGIIIDNTGTYKWTLPRSGDGTFPRTLTIGATGLTVTGAGDVAFTGFVTASAAQTWDIGPAAAVNQDSGSTISGSSKITKTGAGTLMLMGANTGFTGNFDVNGGVLVNNRSSTALGPARGNNLTGTLLTVNNGGTYEVRQFVTGAAVLLNGGSTFRGNGIGVGMSGASGLQGETLAIGTGANAIVNVSTLNASDTFRVNRGFSGGAADGIVNFTGPGTTLVFDGFGNTFLGNFKTNAANLLLGDGATNTPLGANKTIEIAGGNVRLAGTINSSSGSAFTLTGNVTGDSTLLIDRISSGAVFSNTSTGTARSLTEVKIGTNTLGVSAGTNVTSVSVSAPARLGVTTLTINGNPTLDVNNATVPVEFRATTLAGTGNITKTGTGQLGITNGGTFSGSVANTGTGHLLLQNQDAIGSASLHTGAGATSVFTGSPTTWTIDNDLSGGGGTAGNVLFGLTGNNTATLNGVAINPGSTGAAGILNLAATTATLALDVAEKSALTFNIVDADGVAGVDYDQLLITGALAPASLPNATLTVDFTGATGDFTGQTLTLISDVGTVFTSGNSFGTPIFVGGYTGTVNYNDGSITLSGITAVPEPTSLAGLALAGLGLMARRRKTA